MHINLITPTIDRIDGFQSRDYSRYIIGVHEHLY